MQARELAHGRGLPPLPRPRPSGSATRNPYQKSAIRIRNPQSVSEIRIVIFSPVCMCIPLVSPNAGIKHASVFHFPGTQVDIAPTDLGFAGLDAPGYMDGRSLVRNLCRCS
jgi:hypothetical protein